MGCAPSTPKQRKHKNRNQPFDRSEVTSRREALTQINDIKRNVHEDYNIVKQIGEGSLGFIQLVTRRRSTNTNIINNHTTSSNDQESSSTMYALKTIVMSRLGKNASEELLNEIRLLRCLDHPNIVKLYEVYQRVDNYYLIMEFCSGGDLWSRMPYSETEVAKVMKSICSAVSYLHSQGIFHRDLKLENIMFATTSSNALVKVIDFGLSTKFLHGSTYLYDICGTLYTMSPQVVKGTYTNAADNWAIGVISYILLSNQRPFFHRSREQTLFNILSGNYDFNGSGWKNISDNAKNFVSSLLVVDTRKRATAASAIKHKWLQSNCDWKASNKISDEEFREILKENMHSYESACELKKIGLSIIAYKSTSEELLKLHEAFKEFDKDNNGVIQKQEFVAVAKEFNFDDEDINSLFTSIDIFNNGCIQYTEFIAATLETCINIEENRLREVFDQLDIDNDGFISKDDLKGILAQDFTVKKAMKLIEEADLNDDGVISLDEFVHQFKQRSESVLSVIKPSSRTLAFIEKFSMAILN